MPDCWMNGWSLLISGLTKGEAAREDIGEHGVRFGLRNRTVSCHVSCPVQEEICTIVNGPQERQLSPRWQCPLMGNRYRTLNDRIGAHLSGGLWRPLPYNLPCQRLKRGRLQTVRFCTQIGHN